MKKAITFLLLLAGMAGIAQNNSSQGFIATTIPLPATLGTQEVFRFKPGIVTQLQAGTFGFSATDRWTSFGELTTPPSGQRLQGLRIQDEARALVMGYTSERVNGFIQYIGNRGMDIRYAGSFTSTESNIAATFKTNGSSQFGFSDLFILDPGPIGPLDPTPIDDARLSQQVDIVSRFTTGLRVRKGNSSIAATSFTAANFAGPIIATSATFTSDI